MRGFDLIGAATQATASFSDDELSHLLSQVCVILSAPRSGSTLLFEHVLRQDSVWGIGSESHVIFSQFPQLRFGDASRSSGALDGSHAQADVVRKMRAAFLFLLQDPNGRRFLETDMSAPPVWVEKTPRNALNIGFLKALFPEVRFVYLYRDPRGCIASLIEAWQLGLQTGQFVTYPDLPAWHLPAWCFLLPAGWEGLRGRSLAEIACFQWCQSQHAIQEAMANGPSGRWFELHYEALIQDPESVMAGVLNFIHSGANQSPQIQGFDVPSRTTISPPSSDKWLKHQEQIMALETRWRPYLR